MSISRYQGDNTNTVTGLITWLNANKEGTFLENAAIEADSAWSSNYGGTLKISLGDAAFSMGYFASAGSNSPLFKYKVTGGIDYTNQAAISSGTWEYKQGDAILCKNGVIFSGKWTRNGTSSPKDRTYYALVKDNNGDLAVVKSDLNDVLTTSVSFPPTISNNVNPLTKSATVSGQAVFITPARSTLSTQIAQVQVVENSVPVLMENAFLALKTQYAADDDSPSAVTLGGKTYITNGRWYILDE